MDRIKLVKFPQTAVFAVRSAIERSWVKGIQKEKEATGQMEIQLRGNPWSGQGDDACPALYMISEMMSPLRRLDAANGSPFTGRLATMEPPEVLLKSRN